MVTKKTKAKITKARILSAAGGSEYSRNVLSNIQKVEIEEYIFSPFLRANVGIKDEEGMFENYNISGGEIFQLDISFPISDLEFSHNFFVHSISSIAYSETVAYNLELISLDYAVNVSKKISKSFRGKTVEQIITEIYLSNIFTSSKNAELFISHETKSPLNVIIPNFNAYKAINFVAAKALPKSNNYGCFMFFRNLYTYNFIDIFAYINEQNVNPELNYKLGMSNKSGGSGDEHQSYKLTSDSSDLTISDVALKFNNEYLEGIHKDIFGGNMIVHDPLTKKNKNYTFSVINDFDKISKNKSPHIFSDDNNILDSSLIQPAGINKLFYAGNNSKMKHFENSFARNYFLYMINNSIRMSYVNQNPTGLCAVGQIINMTLPTVDLEQKQDAKPNPKANTKLSGKYLVSKVMHIFQGSEGSDYIISVEAFKNDVDPA